MKFGPATIPLVGKNGDAMNIDAINPLGVSVVAYEQGGSFTDLMDKTWARKPATPEEPWGLILYADEVVPGNVIKLAWSCYSTRKRGSPSWWPALQKWRQPTPGFLKSWVGRLSFSLERLDLMTGGHCCSPFAGQHDVPAAAEGSL